jgi:predicted protein tyrosine phosphatase
MPFELTICGLEELGLHRRAGVSHVLSILDPDWPEPEEFGRWDAHHRLLLRFHDVIEDEPPWRAPEAEHVASMLVFGRQMAMDQACHLLVHCHAGVSRSTASALVLLAQADPARDPHAIVAQITRHRPQAWPNLRIVELGDRQLDRRGKLIEAARRHYRAVIAERPEYGALMGSSGRLREVEG